METEVSANEPNYMTELALTTAPFQQALDKKFFYPAPQTTHRLNLLLHLIRASDKVANLVADAGVGKSLLLKQVVERLGDEVRVCLFDAASSQNIHAFLGQCLVAFGVTRHEVENHTDPIALLQQRLYQLQQLQITPVIFIDHASQLAPEIEQAMLTWLSWQQQSHYLLQAVFVSESPLKGLSVIDRLQVVALPSLTESEVVLYLEHRLAQAGYRGELPFDKKTLQRFYQQSRGVPRQLNQLAHQQLLGFKPYLTLKQRILAILKQRLGPILVLATITMLVMAQEQIMRAWENINHRMPPMAEPIIVSPEEEVAIPVIVTDEQAQRDELARLVADIQLEETLPAKQPEMIPAPVSSTSATDSTEQQVENNIVDVAYQSQSWVMTQSPQHYTFQLMGSWQQQEVMKFITRYRLNGDVALFSSARNGRAWYVVLYGRYDSRQAALAAQKQWPDTVKALPSWLRRFASIQRQINNNPVIAASPS